MNKKQIETIGNKYVTFEIETNNFKSEPLNMDKIEFVYENLILIREGKKDVFIQMKDVKIIRGVRQ